MRELEVTCVGPVDSVLGRARLYGVAVRCWTHRPGGLVVLRVPKEHEYEVLRWYAAREDLPGDVVSVVVR